MEIENKNYNQKHDEKHASYCDYSDLPMEIILYIFTYLPYTDCLKAGSTCTRWRDAFFETKFKRMGLVYFTRVCLSDNAPPGKYLLQSNKLYSKYYLKEVTFGPIEELSKYIGQMATKVTIDCVDISEKQFYTFMRNLTNLESLNITRCSALFMSGSLLVDNGTSDIANTFSTIRHLSLRQNQYLSDAIFTRLTSSINTIESLDMSGSDIACQSAIYRRFYPNVDSRPNESILTFKIVANVILNHCKHLKALDFSDTMINGSNLQMLIFNDDICLRQLKLASCRQLKSPGIIAFLKTQPLLKVLNLADTVCLCDENIGILVDELPLIEELNISGCTTLTNEAAISLGNLKHLKSLNISRCTGITSDGISRGIGRDINTQLRRLQISRLEICEHGILNIALNCIELRQLNADYCSNGVTDFTMWRIVKHLRWLRELSLDSCLHLSDVSLIGNNQLPNTKLCFSASSAAEPRLTASNKYSLQLHEDQSECLKSDEVSGIQSLKGLQSLNLSGCTKITDLTLIYGLKFIELTYLNLSNCQHISHLGMKVLVSNCPCIEQLDLSYSCTVDDTVIQIVTTKLSRLKALHINGCSRLTEAALDAILINCKTLKILSARRCFRIYCDIEERLYNLKTLHTLNVDITNTLENAELLNLKRRLDY